MKATSSGMWKFHRKAEQESALCAAPVEHISVKERQRVATARGFIYSLARNTKKKVW